MIIRLFMAQILVSTVLIAGTWLFGTGFQTLSVAVGAGLVTLNLMLLSGAWHWILSKKLIALAVSVIVFKYAIFGIILFVIIDRELLDIVWFVLGLSTLLPSMLVYSLGMRGQQIPSNG